MLSDDVVVQLLDSCCFRQYMEGRKKVFSDGSFAWGSFISTYGVETLDNCRKLADSRFAKVKRIRQRINKMSNLSPNLVFMTLTFRDDVLESTSPAVRRKYVQRYLDSQSAYYVGNVDYGKEKGREHYHAVCLPLNYLTDCRCDPLPWSDKYGFTYFTYVHKADDVKLAKYVSKLSFHAVKSTTGRVSLIYPRGKSLDGMLPRCLVDELFDVD